VRQPPSVAAVSSADRIPSRRSLPLRATGYGHESLARRALERRSVVWVKSVIGSMPNLRTEVREDFANSPNQRGVIVRQSMLVLISSAVLAFSGSSSPASTARHSCKPTTSQHSSLTATAATPCSVARQAERVLDGLPCDGVLRAAHRSWTCKKLRPHHWQYVSRGHPRYEIWWTLKGLDAG
jgi:hypothetical protein